VGGSHFLTAVVSSAATLLVVGGAALAVNQQSSGPHAKRSPAAAHRAAAVGQQVWSGFVDFIDALDTTTYLGIGGQTHAAVTPGAVGTAVVIAGTMGNLRARLTSAPVGGSVTFTAYTNAASTLTCTITPPGTNCSDSVDSLALASDKLIKVQVVNNGTGPLYGARWSATFTPS